MEVTVVTSSKTKILSCGFTMWHHYIMALWLLYIWANVHGTVLRTAWRWNLMSCYIHSPLVWCRQLLFSLYTVWCISGIWNSLFTTNFIWISFSNLPFMTSKALNINVDIQLKKKRKTLCIIFHVETIPWSLQCEKCWGQEGKKWFSYSVEVLAKVSQEL